MKWPYLFLLGALNRNTPLGRVLILPICVAASAWSLWSLEPHRKRGLFGLLRQYPEPTHNGGWAHSLKNILSEWARSDPQRAVKLGSRFVVGKA